MYRRGPMHPALRLFTLALFASVFGSVALSMCFGLAQVGTTSAVVFAEYAPTAEDQRLARELEARAEAYGDELEISAVEIAQARRLGELDKVEAYADERYPRQGTGDIQRSAADGSPHRVAGAFYRDDVPEPAPSAPLPWGWLAVGLVALLGAASAAVAAWMTLGTEPGEEVLQ